MPRPKTQPAFDVDILCKDPRLGGWLPVRRSRQSQGKIQITQLVERPPSSLFDRRDQLVVHYFVNKSDGGVEKKRATFERDRGLNLGSIDAVAKYLAKKVGKLSFDKLMAYGPLVEFPATISSPQDKGLAQTSSVVLRFKAQFIDWFPVDDVGRKIRMRSRYAIDQAFTLGALARELELLTAFEQDASRARKSIAGSAIGAKRSGNKRTEQADAWKRRFAKWLQPLLDSEIATRRKSPSREQVAEFVKAHWPKGGFTGTYERQEQCPEWSTLIATLKYLERQGLLVRPAAKVGRKGR